MPPKKLRRRISIAITEAQFVVWEKIAKADARTLSAWVRLVVEEKIKVRGRR